MEMPKYPDLLSLSPSARKECSLKTNYPDFVDYIHRCGVGRTFSESLYMFTHKLTEIPKCTCGNPLRYLSFNKGYKKYCSASCVGSSTEIQKKIYETTTKRYGGMGAGSKTIHDKIKQTKQELYGSPTFLNPDKAKQTCLERYGTTNGGWSPGAQEKIKATQKKYHKFGGAITAAQQAAYLEFGDIIAFNNDGTWTCSCRLKDKCSGCNGTYTTTPSCHYNRTKLHIELCTTKLPLKAHRSSAELSICDFLNELSVRYEVGNRSVLNGKELDIYIPELKMAIEYNGVYWHNDQITPKNYHMNKTIECLKQGIVLYHVWEDWYINKLDIIKSMISNWVGKTPTRIHARKCVIKEVSASDSKQFLNSCHLQGHATSQVCYGLYYKDELVSLMSFGKPRWEPGESWELIRFCNKLNTNVVGGASKLLKYFIKIHQPTHIISYASSDISNGHLYEKLGFELVGRTLSYWYIEPHTQKRYHRSSFTKKSLIKRGWIDEGETEAEAMNRQGYFRIWDSGQTKWVLNIV